MEKESSQPEHPSIHAMEIFINKKLNKLEQITLMEVVNDIIFRKLFNEFFEKDRINQYPVVNILKRYTLCEKIIRYPELFNNNIFVENLIDLCPSFEWEQRIINLSLKRTKDLNFFHTIEKLKWETITEIICHDNYRYFLKAIKEKSRKIIRILVSIYWDHFF